MSSAVADLGMDETDFEEIDRLLDKLGADDGLRLDGAQGLLTALVVGPEPVGPEDWLPVILGGEPLGMDGVALQSLLDLLLRLQASITRGLDHLAYDPILAERPGEDDETIVDVSGWCAGFSLGVDLNAEIWEQHMQDDPDLLELLAPIVSLGVDDGLFAEVRDPDMPALSESERDVMLHQLGSVLVDLRQYWQDHPSDPALPASGATLH